MILRALKKIRRITTGLIVRMEIAGELKQIYDINCWKKNTIFDVGANDGINFIPVSQYFPWVTVHAFEPTPMLVNQIKDKIGDKKNYIINELAIGLDEGTFEFNIAGQADWGCSSFLDFEDNLTETWVGRDDLKFTDKIMVKTIKLKTYLEEKKIKHIDFLHIDTQGYDLVVLKSLYDYLPMVKRGVVEVPMNESVKLYKNQHTKQEMLDFLTKNKFKIYKITSQQNEENVFFIR